MLGASGAVAGAVGVTVLEAAEAALVPTLLVAVTWNLIAVPLARPVTTSVLAPAPAA